MGTIKPSDFGPFTLSAGWHESPADGMCVNEMVSFLEGEEWSDMPQCESPVVALFCQVINDRFGQGARDRLLGYVPRLIGTASPEHDQKRAEYLAWQAVTVFAPMALGAAGLEGAARALRGLDRSRGLKAAALAARAAARAARAASAADAALASGASGVVFSTLDGLLAIGPSGSAYTQDHLDRAPALREATGQRLVAVDQ